ncbi:MAG: hypothetical protein J6X85_09125 [Ruminococcus sp.]|nr:hypothetical protein [Ruminococcus sp.]
MAVILLGALFSYIWTDIFLISFRTTSIDYDEPAYVGYFHNVLHSEYGITVKITLFIALVSLTVIASFNPEKIPPLPQALCFGFTVLGEILFIFVIIQFAINYSVFILPLAFYLVNVIIATAKLTRRYITAHLEYKANHDTVYRFKIAEKLEEKLSGEAALTAFHFLMILPAALILIILYVILGQGPDGVIKAFTMTADWTFSKQIPPPPIDYEGHYLCTVAAGGHEKIVKPVRYGKRRGETIVVNRQLLASNAFEDLIMERTPRFHRAVRGFYDKHGYPVSKLITTRTRADVVYFVMKPLEWMFILFLYTFDTHPENRIAVQYSDYHKK